MLLLQLQIVSFVCFIVSLHFCPASLAQCSSSTNSHLLCPALLPGSPFTPQDTARTRQSRLIDGTPSSKEHCGQPEEDTTTNPDKDVCLWCEIIRNRRNNESCKAGSCGKHKHTLQGWTSSQAVQHRLTHHCVPPGSAFCGTFLWD